MSERSYDLFLSYNWRDRESAEGIARRLKERGLHVFLDRWYLVPGRPWIKVLEEVVHECGAIAVLLGPNGMGPWQQREKNLALSRQACDPGFPVIPTLLPGANSALGFLSLETWVDFRKGIEDDEALQILELAVRGEPPGPDGLRRMREARSSVCPYRGLRPFREEDEPFFFGREDYTDKLASMVERHSLVAVVGASGSGKSSVVRAGLVPRARQGIGDQLWEVATLVPGESPLRSLAAALLPFLEPEMTEVDRLREVKKLAQAFHDEDVPLNDVVTRVLEKQRGTDRLLLVVDQWEEIYTLCQDHQSRTRFIDELLEATKRGFFCAVLTLRGDFFDRILEHRRLADRLQDQVVHLGPMTREELGRVIEKPAAKVGLSMESGLSERILNDVREAPGSLPYLEFVLTRLWDDRHAGKLTHAAYEGLGETEGKKDSGDSPMQRVMATYAEGQLEKLLVSGHGEETMRRLLLRLVQLGEKREATRRRATLEGMGEEERLLVRQLADARLLVTDREEASGEEMVELAHEALIGSWKRLKDWIDQDREFLLWRRRLESAMESWQASGQDKSALLRGGPLAEAERWESGRELSAPILGFIRTSRRARLKESRRRRTVLGAVAAVLLAATLLAVGAYLLAVQRQNEAKRLLAQIYWSSGQKAVANQEILGASHFFARSAAQYWDDSEIRTTRLRLSTLGSVSLLQRFAQGLVLGAAYSHEEGRVLSWSGEGTVQIWNVADGSPAAPTMKHDDWVVGATFNSDEGRVLSWSRDGTLRIWNAADGTPTAPPMKHDGTVLGAVFSLDDGRVLSWSLGGTVRIWNATDGTPAAPPMKHEDRVLGAVFSRGEGQVLSWSLDGTVRIWNATDGTPAAPLMKHDGPVLGAVFSRGEGRVLSWSQDGTVRIWNAADGASAAPPIKHDAVSGAAFSRDEGRVLSWSQDGTVRIWNAADGASAASPIKHDAVSGAVFSRDEGRILSWSRDGTVRIWNAVDGTPSASSMKHGDRVVGAVFSRDEGRVFSWSWDGTVRIWNSADGTPAAPPMKHEEGVLGATFSRDEGRVLSRSRDGIRIWNAIPGTGTAHAIKHEGGGLGAVFSRDEDQVLSWSWDGTVRIWTAANGTPSTPPMKHDQAVLGAVFSRDGSRVLSWSWDGTLRIWNAADGTPTAPPMKYDGPVLGAVFSRDESRVLGWSPDGTVRIWKAADGTPSAPSIKHGDRLVGAVFSRGEGRVLSWSWGGTVRIWNAADSTPASLPMKHDGPVLGAIFSRDESRVLSWSADGTVRIWKATDGTPSAPPMKHDQRVDGAVFSGDEGRVLSWSWDGTVRTWNATDGTASAPPMKHDQAVLGAVFSRDESQVLSWSTDGTVRIWNATDGTPSAPPMNHDYPVWGAAFSSDEGRVLSWSQDGTVRIWNAVDGTPAAPPMNHDQTVWGAVFDRDENRVLSWSQDGTVRAWNLWADYDFPQEHLPLLIEVASSTRMDNLGNVTVLDRDTWQRKKAKYVQIAEEHWKSCRYKEANVYAVQKEYWPRDEE